MAANTLPFEYGSKATLANDPGRLADVGNVYYAGQAAYRLVQNVTAALLLTANGKFVDDNAVTTTLNYKTAALSAVTSVKALGVVSTAQVSLNIGDFFLVQVGGVASVSGATTTATNGLTTAASGLVAAVTGTWAVGVGPTIVGTALNTVAGGVAFVRLQNLN
jgi:hypothetical protein